MSLLNDLTLILMNYEQTNIGKYGDCCNCCSCRLYSRSKVCPDLEVISD